jgi:hypothetical protein
MPMLQSNNFPKINYYWHELKSRLARFNTISCSKN